MPDLLNNTDDQTGAALRTIHDAAIADIQAGSDPWSAIGRAGQSTRTIVATGAMSNRAAVEFLCTVARSIRLDPERKHVLTQIKRTLRKPIDAPGDFIRDENGKIIPILQHNVRVGLDRLGVLVRHDDFADRFTIAGFDGFDGPLSDKAMTRLRLRLDEELGFLPSKELFVDVLFAVGLDNRCHPVRDYLSGLRWDGRPRIARWLAAYCGAADSPLNQAIGAAFLIAAVRRVREPGCKFDEMLVLEGPQGIQKSTVFSTLAVRDDWFTDSLHLSGRDKELMEVMAGRWIAEVAELSGLRKAEIEKVKALLSRREDIARMAYDRTTSHRPRQFVICGTTNSPKYLRDTENRRFWPVRVGIIDIDGLRRDRDQLWAEAAHHEAEGVSIRLDPSLWADAAIEQAARVEVHPIEEFLSPILHDHEGIVRTDDLWRALGKITPGERTQADNGALGVAMQRLGWSPTRVRWKESKTDGEGPRVYCYRRGKSDARLHVRYGVDRWECVEDKGDEAHQEGGFNT